MPKTKSVSVEYVKQAVPAFLQRFKQETGYQEHDISDKSRNRDQEGEERPDREDERPQVVQLSQHDLTAEEASKCWEEEKGEKTEKKKEEEEEEADLKDDEEDGKLKFKKPAKRDSSSLDFNVSKKKKLKEEKKKEKKKGIKNATLLSFGDDDEEEKTEGKKEEPDLKDDEEDVKMKFKKPSSGLDFNFRKKKKLKEETKKEIKNATLSFGDDDEEG